MHSTLFLTSISTVLFDSHLCSTPSSYLFHKQQLVIEPTSFLKTRQNFKLSFVYPQLVFIVQKRVLGYSI